MAFVTGPRPLPALLRLQQVGTRNRTRCEHIKATMVRSRGHWPTPPPHACQTTEEEDAGTLLYSLEDGSSEESN